MFPAMVRLCGSREVLFVEQ
jgi:hypothetical protein